MTRISGTGRGLAMLTIVLIGATASACGTGTPGGSGGEPTTASTTAAPTQGATSTSEPTPALSADDALHAYLADRRLFLQGTFAATYTSGDVAGELSGTYVARGDDFSIRTTNAVPGWVERVDQLLVEGNGYERKNEGRWYAAENVYLSRGLAAIIHGASWVDESKPGWFAPEEMDLLALASAIGALPANLTMEGTDEVDGEVLAQIEPTGELTALDIELSITSAMPELDEERAEWSFAFTFESGSASTAIEAPDEVWRQELLPNAMALVELPSTYERQEQVEGSGDLYFGPDGEGFFVTVGPANGMTPAENYAGLVTFFTSDPENGWGGPPELDEEASIGGGAIVIDVTGSGPTEREPTPGRLIAAHSLLEGTEVYQAKAIVQLGDTVYVLHWLGLADGTESHQLDLFKEIASTFTPLN